MYENILMKHITQKHELTESRVKLLKILLSCTESNKERCIGL